MAEVTWYPDALDGLNEIAEYIAVDSGTSARLLIQRVFLATERLTAFPESGRVFSGDPSGLAREILVGNYRVIYRLSGGEIQISAVVHGAREIRIEDVPPLEPANG